MRATSVGRLWRYDADQLTERNVAPPLMGGGKIPKVDKEN
jgi:hypothetical protein